MTIPACYRSRRGAIRDSVERAMRLQQISDLAAHVEKALLEDCIMDLSEQSPTYGLRVVWEQASMHHICDIFVLPFTSPHTCSFVELVATASQPPTWFCSHWWGTPFCQTVSMLRFHAHCHGLDDTSTYWICTFANNQHDLQELGKDVMLTPFARAIQHEQCLGTCVLCDSKATPMNRIWCVLEFFVTKEYAVGKLFEVATIIEEGSQKYHSSGYTVPAGPALRMDCCGRIKEFTCSGEGRFPESVAFAGVDVSVANAQASLPNDRTNILHMIAGSNDRASQPPTACPGYARVDAIVHGLFAGAAVYCRASEGSADSLQRLLDSKANVNEQRADGESAIFQAAGKGHHSCVDLLLKAGAQVNMADRDGFTALMKAAWQGHERCVRLLLLARADANMAETRNGQTPLRMAQSRTHPSCAELLHHACS